MSLNTESIMAEWRSLESTLNQRFQTTEGFRWITKQSGGKILPAHVCAVSVLLVILLVAFDVMSAFLSTMVVTIYPAFASLVAIGSTDKAVSTQWLSYWVIFAAFTALEGIVSVGNLVSFYHLGKMLFLTWCYLPSTQVRVTRVDN